MKTKLFSLNARDFFKGLIVAIIAGVLTFVINELQAGTEINILLFKRMGITAIIAFLSYILKNLMTNSDDKLLTPEEKKHGN